MNQKASPVSEGVSPKDCESFRKKQKKEAKPKKKLHRGELACNVLHAYLFIFMFFLTSIIHIYVILDFPPLVLSMKCIHVSLCICTVQHLSCGETDSCYSVPFSHVLVLYPHIPVS